MISQTKLSDAFRRERARQGLSLRDAAEATGVPFVTLGRFEKCVGKANPYVMVVVANWLKIDLFAKPVVVYPKNTLDAILDVIRADGNIKDKDSLCTLFSMCYKEMVKV